MPFLTQRSGRGARPRLLLLSLASVASTHLITSPATFLTARSTVYPALVVETDRHWGRLAGPPQELEKRDGQDCDNHGIIHCPTGTCYTGGNGLIGCCSASTCVPRTRCIPFTTNAPDCNPNTGGCLYCSDRSVPYCFTITNALANQYAHYCNTAPGTEILSYSNSVKASTQSSPASTSADSTKTGTSNLSSSSPTSSHISTEAPPGSILHPADGNTANHGISNGLIAGAVVGAGVGAALMCILWFTRKKWVALLSTQCCTRRKGSRKGSYQQEYKACLSPGSFPAPSTYPESHPAQQPSPVVYSPNDFTHHQELDSLQVSHSTGRPGGLGILAGGDCSLDQKRYAITNPDPDIVAGTTRCRSRPPPWGEPPHLPTAVSASGVSPMTPHSTNSTSGTATPTHHPSPLLPGYKYQAYSPSTTNQQPPNGGKRNGCDGCGAYHHSHPPQSYPTSNVTANDRGVGVHHGPSGHGENPPWAYLSPEEAISGGWTNSSTTAPPTSEGANGE